MYLDPSFGGMLLQIVIAIIVAGGAIMYGFRRKIGKLFKKKKTTADALETQSNPGEVVDMMNEDRDK